MFHQTLHVIFRLFWFEEPSFPSSCPTLEVLSALTGEPIAVLETEEGADCSVKVLKQRLAQKLGLTRFRLRLIQDNRPIDDNETMSLKVVQLVILEFMPPDFEQDKDVMMACQENDDKLLEEQLSQPRDPNFEDADDNTPLCSNPSRKLELCAFAD